MHGCDNEEEEIHIFFTCMFAKGLWFSSPWGIRWEDNLSEDIDAYLNLIWKPKLSGLMEKKDREDIILYSATILEHLWCTRNEKLHKDIIISMESSIQKVRERFNELKGIQIMWKKGTNQVLIH